MAEPIEGKATRTCFVYDKENGEVVHIHQFVPWRANDAGDAAEIREAALGQAGIGRADRSRLAVLDLEGDHYSGDVLYRVKPESRELLRERISDFDPEGRLAPKDVEARTRCC